MEKGYREPKAFNRTDQCSEISFCVICGRCGCNPLEPELEGAIDMEIKNGLVFKWKYVTTIVEWKQHFLKSEAQQKYGFQ